MEPKDLKNSEELEITSKTGAEKENKPSKPVDESPDTAEINLGENESENLETENSKEAPLEGVAPASSTDRDSNPQSVEPEKTNEKTPVKDETPAEEEVGEGKEEGLEDETAKVEELGQSILAVEEGAKELGQGGEEDRESATTEVMESSEAVTVLEEVEEEDKGIGTEEVQESATVEVGESNEPVAAVEEVELVKEGAGKGEEEDQESATVEVEESIEPVAAVEGGVQGEVKVEGEEDTSSKVEESGEPIVAAEEVEEEGEEVGQGRGEEKKEPEVIAAPAPSPKTVAPDEKPAKEVQKIEVIKKETVDYSKYSAVELVNALRDILENPGDIDLKNEIEIIKSAFYKQLNESIEEAKKAFVDAGGNEEEFEPEEDPYENDIKNLLKDYRQLRIDYNRKLDSEKEDNLKKKYEVIEQIKGLINNEESINRTFNEFRDLQREWREIGLVPQAKMKNLWDTYHFHVENFYDYIKINRELRDLDLKKNLEIKIELCEQAEELLVEPSIVKAFNQLQKYHEEWREAGPVPRDNKDDIWDRFKAVTSKINKKHQEYFESKKTDQKKNLEAKIALCEKVEEIGAAEIVNYRDWDTKSKELVKLQKVWRTIGFAPKKDNNKIYDRFRTACDTFFNKKRDFYAKNKEIQQNNLQNKIDLCEQAESLKDNDDWKKTTQDLINIQKEWKEIGPVPRKHSDALWNRFRTACDFFFDKKSDHFSEMDTEQVDNLKLKEDLIAEAVNFKSTGDVDENLRIMKSFQRRWTEIGHVPFKKKDDTQNRFREAINVLYDELNINEEKRNLLKFKSKMSSYSESNRGQNKMRMEREKYMTKLKQLESDLILLDNNIGFFANTKNAESLIEDVKRKIEDSRQTIEQLKEKIRVIDAMEN